MTGEVVLQAESVGVVFHPKGREVEALRDFSLEVREGEIVALIGPSGCGKSTFLRLLAGFLPSTSGRLFYRGRPLSGIQTRLTMIFQHFALFPWKSVYDNIAFGLQGSSMPREEVERTVRQQLKLMHLEGFETAFPSQLSGGMRQRVALARALVREPDVLLMDEPFAALDAMTRRLLQQEVGRLVATRRQTVILVTHSIEEALLLSHRVVVMTRRPGRVKAHLPNTLPFPRDAGVESSALFHELKERIWSQVEQEILMQMEERA